ncbi:DUF4279 domain-containing protein [Paenibacillus sinopodophylli]|uniref:DUF4279 domain-containing protein n=1 Tax=Paenibacillus sinopodophylli TaxID=1837342 RepID=UPI00110CF8E9|nr:DUF4279 domain-containing protein [Paenibacillus sinopodophylli]
MSFTSVACSLLIRGDDLNKESISNGLNLNPTNYILKGQQIKKTKFKAPKDIWTYEVKLVNEELPNTVLYNLISKLKHSKNYIINTSFEDICIRLYLQSDLAQIYFDIEPNVLKELAELKIRFEVSILSWGGGRR